MTDVRTYNAQLLIAPSVATMRRQEILDADHLRALVARSDFDIRRLKQCSICEKLYYANRIAAKACSVRCSNTWRQRMYYLRHYKNKKKK